MSYQATNRPLAFHEYARVIQQEQAQYFFMLVKRGKMKLRRLRRWFFSWIQNLAFQDASDVTSAQGTFSETAKGPSNRFAKLIASLAKRQSELRGLAELSRLSDHALRDIGVSRDEIASMRNLPLGVSISDELNRAHGRLVQN